MNSIKSSKITKTPQFKFGLYFTNRLFVLRYSLSIVFSTSSTLFASLIASAEFEETFSMLLLSILTISASFPDIRIVLMSGKLAEMVSILRSSIEKVSSNSAEAIREAKRVEEVENTIDSEYLKTKSLFVKYSPNLNCGVLVIFDDLIEFIEQAADMCADTADYINILSNRE